MNILYLTKLLRLKKRGKAYSNNKETKEENEKEEEDSTDSQGIFLPGHLLLFPRIVLVFSNSFTIQLMTLTKVYNLIA